MKELRYIGAHAPREIVNVPDKKVDELIKTGLYESLDEPLILIKPKSGVEKKESVKEPLDEDEE